MSTMVISPELKARIKLAAIRENMKVEEWMEDKCVKAELAYFANQKTLIEK